MSGNVILKRIESELVFQYSFFFKGLTKARVFVESPPSPFPNFGCKVAAPDRPAVAYVGDGAWGMSFGEILTCVREDIPVTAVVFNNQQWGAEKKNQVDFYSNRFLGVNLDNPSWAEVARSLGAEGRTIEKTSEVGPALADACRAQQEGKTTVLEIMVTRELGDPFRRDALKLPKRLLSKYRDYSND